MGENKFVIAIWAGVSSFPARQLNACYAGYSIYRFPLLRFRRALHYGYSGITDIQVDFFCPA
jgi:hypothetical protein